MRCTRVEPHIVGTWTVHFHGDPEPVRKPFVEYRRCDNAATEDALTRDGEFQFHWCAKHATEPTCGGLVAP